MDHSKDLHSFERIFADLTQSWHIPRPTLARSSASSGGSTPSNNSTQSAKSGTLLLTAANLAKVASQDVEKNLTTNKEHNLQLYLQQVGPDHLLPFHKDLTKKPDGDTVSVASSTHFTVINVNSRPQVKTRSFCRKHQLTILVVSMSIIFTIGLLAAIILFEMRANHLRKMT
ncbi:uncharacterized protein LOC108732537 isoform X2 [Agrilus planipennis]|uniref:Uncharacterized protein LOC108732537 isoform X2 n=1 Tax=Agrilus planipennis TaxID=224129 RepID=A0A1W4WEN1_AGRPL|nr:uncharacterized protein LOC108732537 isoform X2 [Agrilus planipennis]